MYPAGRWVAGQRCPARPGLYLPGREPVQIVGPGNSSAEPIWTCASADTLVASAIATSFGCSATGTGTGATTISAAVTQGTAAVSASASLRVAGERDTFAYWDGNGNGDLTCTEATADEGLRLPAYKHNRDGTGLIYELVFRSSPWPSNRSAACP